MPATTVDIYCRVAMDDASTNQRLDDQEQACRRYCEQNGLTIGHVHRDTGSGVRLDRPGLTDLRTRATQGAIQGIVVARLDRLARTQGRLFFLLNDLARQQVAVYAARERLEDNPISQYVDSLHQNSQKEVK